MKVSVHLVTWNGAKYIAPLFDSLRKQSFADWELLIIDNNSTDDTVARVKTELTNFLLPYRLIINHDNIGFAGGHNQAVHETNGEYILLLNQDMYLMPDCLEKMARFLDTHAEVAAVAPRLMRWDFVKYSENNLMDSFSTVVDALGIKVYRNRRAVEQYTSTPWAEVRRIIGNVDILEVFGASGAFPMYRRSDIEQIYFSDGTFFDMRYHSYKEDLDVAYRLQQIGKKAYILLDVVAYHDRSGAGPAKLSDITAVRNKKEQSAWIKYYSYKNHLATLYKNEYWQNFVLDAPWIAWYELKKFIYFCIFDRQILKGLIELWQNRDDFRSKRLHIIAKRSISWHTIRKWWIK